jgi:hypothetical protein
LDWIRGPFADALPVSCRSPMACRYLADIWQVLEVSEETFVCRLVSFRIQEWVG